MTVFLWQRAGATFQTIDGLGSDQRIVGWLLGRGQAKQCVIPSYELGTAWKLVTSWNVSP